MNIGGTKMKIQESGEMYLEHILILSQQINHIRAIDIVNRTGYSKPSISRALKLLKEDGFINIDKSGYISLTASGEQTAKKIYERHNILSGIFRKIGVSVENAVADACKIEHDISDETFEKLKQYFTDK
jgi:Mn-dependent DtxR family transcriptional regulator